MVVNPSDCSSELYDVAGACPAREPMGWIASSAVEHHAMRGGSALISFTAKSMPRTSTVCLGSLGFWCSQCTWHERNGTSSLRTVKRGKEGGARGSKRVDGFFRGSELAFTTCFRLRPYMFAGTCGGCWCNEA
jgi:hypothetical protein